MDHIFLLVTIAINVGLVAINLKTYSEIQKLRVLRKEE